MSRAKPEWRPPARDGVGASCVVTPDGARPDLLSFLVERLPVLSRDEWAGRLAAGEVLDERGQPLAVNAPYRPRTRLWYWRQVPDEVVVPFQETLLFQDEHLVVAHKPHFLAVSPKGRYARETLQARLQRRLGLDTLVPLHRLDRETAGLVVFGVRPDERHAYQSLFRERQVHKGYHAVAPAAAWHRWPLTRQSRIVPGERFMQMVEVPGEPNALSHIDCLQVDGSWALYRLEPHTGRTHQLRVHMQALGLPLRGDRIYPELLPAAPEGELEDTRLPLQLLARELRFVDPITAQPHHFVSPATLQWPVNVV